MIDLMSTPTDLREKDGYWTTTWNDTKGGKRTKRFGNVQKVGKRKADAEYAKWLQTWSESDPDTIQDLCAAYQKHAEKYYRRKDGTLTGEAANIADALKHVTDLYGDLPAANFSPANLIAVRKAMAKKLARTTINQRVNKIRRCWQWAVAEEYLPPSCWHGLLAVQPLSAGRTTAKEAEKRTAIADATIDATLPNLTATVRAMVQIQRLTGCRPGDLFVMRHMDIDRSGRIWLYKPERHKGSHLGKTRTVFIGPRAQAILAPLLGKDLTALVFQTRYSTAWNRRGYRQAIVRGARKAELTDWSPYDLRHSAATRIRKEYGEEAARVVLGHSKLETTAIYGELDIAKAADVMREIG